MSAKGIFITGTDTNIGKTVATLVLGVLAQEKGIDIGVMKPVQCAGNDGQFLKRSLGVKDSLAKINPYFANEPLSPHLAFARQKKAINIMAPLPRNSSGTGLGSSASKPKASIIDA